MQSRNIFMTEIHIDYASHIFILTCNLVATTSYQAYLYS